MTTIAETELETELQEVYIQARHWLEDITFLETDSLFFRNIIVRYQHADAVKLHSKEIFDKIKEQENKLADLKAKVPAFLTFLKPFIGDIKKEMDLGFLNRYNALKNELAELFSLVRATKNELFHYTESIVSPIDKY